MLSLVEARYARKVALKAINKREQPTSHYLRELQAVDSILRDFAKFDGALKPLRTPWKRMNVRSNYFESLR